MAEGCYWLLKVPNRLRATIRTDKIVGYLLSSSHPRGRDKADFLTRFGFHTDWWLEVEAALRSHALRYDVAEIEETSYGIKYNVDGSLETPDGRNPVVRTVWQVDRGTSIPRFITLRPAPRRARCSKS